MCMHTNGDDSKITFMCLPGKSGNSKVKIHMLKAVYNNEWFK